jgi:hypothetical protein
MIVSMDDQLSLAALETRDATARKLTAQQIGRLGELLVQYELLRCGIDSALMTTDAGVDLVAYSGMRGRSITIQVKTNLAPKPGGGKGALAIDWWVDENCPAELYTLVELSTRRVWILTREELVSTAQQRSNRGYHLYMYTDAAPASIAYGRHGDDRFSRFIFDNRVSSLFG